MIFLENSVSAFNSSQIFCDQNIIFIFYYKYVLQNILLDAVFSTIIMVAQQFLIF